MSCTAVIRGIGKWLAFSAMASMLGLPLCAQQAGAAGLQPSSDGSTPNQRPPILQQVGIDQHLNEQLPLNLHFRDEAGKEVTLGDYFNKRPVILSLVYYRCPMLCGEVLNGLTSSLNVVNFDLGRDFEVVSVSIDPHETPDDAAKMKEVYLRRYSRHSATSPQGWRATPGRLANNGFRARPRR